MAKKKAAARLIVPELAFAGRLRSRARGWPFFPGPALPGGAGVPPSAVTNGAVVVTNGGEIVTHG